MHVWVRQPGRLMLVTEYLEGGDLCSALERDSAIPRRFSWWKHQGEERRPVGLARRVAIDVARGLAYLHSRKVSNNSVQSRVTCWSVFNCNDIKR